MDSSFITVKPQPSNNDHNKPRRPWVKQMITVDNRGVNMTLIHESIISLLSVWPLAMILIKLSEGAAFHHPRVQQHSEFPNRPTTSVLTFQPLFLYLLKLKKGFNC